MTVSVFDLFSIGLGPSSSHTVGPMRAGRRFVETIENLLGGVERIEIELFGSLALTGEGHGTNWALILGLEGYYPDKILPAEVHRRLDFVKREQKLNLLGKHTVPFVESRDLIYHKDKYLPYHANALRCTVYDAENVLAQKIYYSVGGGFIVDHDEKDILLNDDPVVVDVPYIFSTSEELLHYCDAEATTIEQIVLANEKKHRSEEEVRKRLLYIWQVMKDSIKRGVHTEGLLPGVLRVPRRASNLYEQLSREDDFVSRVEPMDWVSLVAIAVAEENAAGGRVVTAPTNGSAGIIPSVLYYYKNFTDHPTDDGIITFLLVAGAIGILFKEGASISGAEVGCQGEVGVACSMAAAGLTAALGGTNNQVENAAEIGMEHNLGLTCDPVAGLVQIPCIERNAMGGVKAVSAARLALRGDGRHKISLDAVIATMRQTGVDMNAVYKETSQGGLAVNVPEC